MHTQKLIAIPHRGAGDNLLESINLVTLDKQTHVTPSVETSRYLYLSPSYNHFGKWIVTLFGDFESKLNSPVEFDNLKEKYFGLDITYYMSNNNIVSLFFGSQKGGLVCANGTCIVQPDFKNGFKITSRMIF